MMKEDPVNRTRWKHKYGWHNRRNMWDKMATCWAGEEDWTIARKKQNSQEEKYKFITYILNKMKLPIEHRHTKIITKERDRQTALGADDPPRKIQITSQSQQHINNQTLKHCKDLFTDPLRISLLEELTLPALAHPSLSCTAEGSGPAYFFLMTIARLFFGVWDSRRTPFPDSILGVCHAFLLGAHTPLLIPQRTEVLHQLSDEAFTCLSVTRD